MGMFDTIRFRDDAAPRCAAAHRIDDLQTKDLECEMTVYSVHGGQLYRPAKDRSESIRIDDEARLILTETRVAEPASVTVDMRAYSTCDDCRPILYLSDAGWRGDYVQERRPWCEWRFVLRDGRLERVEEVRVESRAAVAAALRREGLEVLDDDERLARLHLERGTKHGGAW